MYKRTGKNAKTLNPNNTVIFGTPALIGAGIINPKQEKAITERVNYFSKNLDNFLCCFLFLLNSNQTEAIYTLFDSH